MSHVRNLLLLSTKKNINMGTPNYKLLTSSHSNVVTFEFESSFWQREEKNMRRNFVLLFI